ncbi:TonB-dependent receptor [Pricia antarctica]|nr:TonB-dependent receptor [Pricia antarctica]
MKLTAILLLVSIFSVEASVYSQKNKVTLDLERVQTRRVLETIESLTDLKFFYNNKNIDSDRLVSVKVIERPVSEVLDILFKGTSVYYILRKKQVVLNLRNIEKPASKDSGDPLLITDQEVVQQSVSGTVTDENDAPLPGANILEKGTTNGVQSDFDGNFSLTVGDDAVLVISYIGFKTVEIQVDGQSNISVSMEEDAAGLDEIVVVGYGRVKKADLTGSVGSVDAADLQEVKVSNVQQALLGKVAGVQIKPNDGTPGAPPQIIIRGVGSLSAGSDPLYVVDGFPVPDLQTLNPDDIQSMDILKDASATAIYGSRGSNGVVLITTKRGQEGKARINLDISSGLQEVSQIPHYMNAFEQATYAYWGSYFRTLDLGGDVSGPPEGWQYRVPQTALDILDGKPGTADVNWIEEVLRTAPVSSYQLSASGGSEDIKYAVSGEYLDQEGIIIGSSFSRYSLRANLDAQLTEKLALKVNLNPSYTERLGENPEGTGYGTSILGNATSINPYSPVYDENGDYFVINGLPEVGNFPNPVALANEVTDKTSRTNFFGNIDLSYSITDDLIFNVMAGANLSSSRNLRFVPDIPSLIRATPFGSDTTEQVVNWISEFTLNYDKNFGEHHITGLAGFTTQKNKFESNFLESDKFPNNLIPYLNSAGGILTNGGAGISEWSLISYLGRVNYDFANKYYMTASIRTDGSSRFGSENRYGVFPSAAVAWRISEENFLQDFDAIDNLKLRLSYGETGNNNIGNYASLATIDNVNYPLANSPVGGFVLNRIGNPNLTWEKQGSFNIGLDVSAFNSRVNFTLDGFRTINKSLLLNVNIPAITGFTSSLQNIGKIENKGWELGINTVNFRGDFRWTTDFNISSYQNEVLKLGPEGDPIIGNRHITTIGEPLGAFYGLVQDGIFETQTEYDQGPIYNPGGSNRTRVGDVKFRDFSGPDGVPDGAIDSYDRVILGSPYPDFYYGMTNRFNYNSLSLSISLQGVQGNKVGSLARDVGGRNELRVNQLALYNDFWRSEEEPGDGNAQRPNDEPTGGIREFSTQKLDNGSYLRINNISLGYELPTSVVERLKMRSIRLYVNASNPFTFTKFEGFNPDVSRGTDPLAPGEDNNNYPLAKTWTLGLNLGF